MPDFISIPFSAPIPVETIIDVGVASPKAHGHAMTKTDTNIENAKPKFLS